MRIEQANLVELWLYEAKLLHKSTKSDQLSSSLPVLRRLLSSKILVGLTLPKLQKDISIIQRKHLLQLLAVENGFKSWVAFKTKLESITGSVDEHLPPRLKLKGIGYPALWFSNLEEAELYAKEHGGEAIVFGTQAVIAPNAD
ncbi:hypothetical protein [Vibrio sp. 10N.261.55.A7]|uniref:hypothetical protein n=1 Tax=Vibrio sp. 10N.261.55.A7 TaxID=1880851 RepID=UPI000C827394|nr:hypothetical protein [Vibrio sp. 10N.261.55.A7]PMJ91743.1 hypothetical protein BCU12_09205 [Vibrio sp. 10N.261.55.A7]